MDTAHISALLEPYLQRPLSPSQLKQISEYIALLLRWNARINLTAIRNEEEIVSRHFGESLFLARHLFPDSSNASHPETRCHPERSDRFAEREAAAEPKDPYMFSASATSGEVASAPVRPQQVLSPRVIDIGSGAGFPAIPLKIWAPEIHLTLIESNHKKAAFLNEVARLLALTEIDVMNDRTETLTTRLSSQADVVTLRAVDRFQTILPQAAAFLAPTGRLALLITTSQSPYLETLTTVKWRSHIRLPGSSTGLLSIGYRV
jgi:16S rRNA (guanine527-N7)-methyltransferase